jgi:hypothetical protein
MATFSGFPFKKPWTMVKRSAKYNAFLKEKLVRFASRAGQENHLFSGPKNPFKYCSATKRWVAVEFVLSIEQMSACSYE